MNFSLDICFFYVQCSTSSFSFESVPCEKYVVFQGYVPIMYVKPPNVSAVYQFIFVPLYYNFSFFLDVSLCTEGVTSEIVKAEFATYFAVVVSCQFLNQFLNVVYVCICLLIF